MDQNDLHSSSLVGRGVRIALISALVILALFLLAETIRTVQNFGRPDHSATNTITVTGSGQATLPPDVARISFTVQNTAATVASAQSATTKQANAAIDYVKGQNIADKDITTLAYNITPQYAYRNCPPNALCPVGSPTVTGYQVSETIQVTEHDLSAVGTVLSGLGSLGVQNISGPNFGLEDATEGYDAARADAIAKAKTQAQLLAGQLGISLGKITSFSESSNTPYPQPMFAAAMGSGASRDAASTPVLPTGQNTYTANVTITYEIR